MAELGEASVRLASADNFRDVAGIEVPYVAADGAPLRRGVLFRSSELQLSDVDARRIVDLGITTVYDLRSRTEVDAHPDVEVPGARWQHVEVAGIPMTAVERLIDIEQADQVMHDVYRAFVAAPGARAAFAELFRRIAETGPSGAQLFHCTAGKDRTGWAAALLLHHAGVADAVVLEDYLLSNQHGSGTREKYLGLVREHLGADHVPIYERVMMVDEAYLQTAYDAVTDRYGDRAAYLRDGLGLDDDVLRRLRAMLRS